MKKLLMIDPDFPRADKTKNHKDLLPIGLLKIGAYYKDMGYEVRLLRLCESKDPIDFQPTEIKITSLFTYYSKYVIDAVKFAREHYPNVPIEVGGIWASLMPEECKALTGADDVFVGVMDEAENYEADYSLLSSDIDFQIIHTQRGCIRRCETCGVYCIEPKLSFRKSIKSIITKKKLLFYDNNILLNPYIENILRELIVLKRKRLITSCESQSGFDGRILTRKPHLAKMIKDAGFINPKIAWDGKYKTWRKREEEINLLKNAGYLPKKIGVFFLVNHELDYYELEKKRVKCWEWGVQVVNCRYRPLNQLDDNYNGRKKEQSSEDYYIHPNWTHKLIKRFNRNVKLHNTCIRFHTQFFSKTIAYKKIPTEESRKLINLPYEEASKYLDDCWNPAEIMEVEK